MRFFSPVRVPVKAVMLAGLLAAAGCTGAEWDSFQAEYNMPRGYYYNLVGSKSEADVLPEKRAESFFSKQLPQRHGGMTALPEQPEKEVGLYPGEAVRDDSVTVYPLAEHPLGDNYMGADWAGMAQDITNQILSREIPVEPVFLSADNPTSALNQAFGSLFEQELNRRGVKVTVTHGYSPYSLWYNVLELTNGEGVLVEAFLLSGQAVIAEASGTYPIGAADSTAHSSAPYSGGAYIDSYSAGAYSDSYSSSATSYEPMALITKP